MNVVISILGLVLALGLLSFLSMKGVNIFVIAISCSILVAVSGGINVYNALIDSYMTGFVSFLKNYFFMFLVGAIFGKIMESSNGAKAIAKLVIRLLGTNRAAIAIPVATGLICYGGVNAFVSVFAVFPIAIEVYRAADIPRRFLPAALFFGAATFAMVAPGTPQIQNLIPCNTVGVDLMAGAVPGFISAGVMLVVGCFWLGQMTKKAQAAGERFIAKDVDIFNDDNTDIPSGFLSIAPLIVTLILLNIKIGGANIVKLEVGVAIGCICAIILLHKHIKMKDFFQNDLGDAAKNTMMMIGNTCAVVGFGMVVRGVPAFEAIVAAVGNIPGPPLVGVAVGTTLVAGITGSASGGLGIAAPILGPIYLSQGVNAAAIARVMAVASSALDSLPHNGAVVTVIHGVCHETHESAYLPVFKLTVVTPAIATVVVVILSTLML